MRAFFGIFLFLLLSATLTGQQRQVRVEMKSGKVFEAQLKDVTEERVLLILPEGELSVRSEEIAKIVELSPPKGKPDIPLPPGADPEVGQPGWSLEEIGAAATADPGKAEPKGTKPGGSPPAAPGTETRAQPPSTPAADPASPDARVARLVDRFLWIVPQSNGNRISLGATIFILLVLLIQLCTRMANLEGRNLGKSGAFAAFLFVILALELSLTPPELPFLVGVAVLDVLLWFLLVHMLFSAGAYGSTVMLLSFLLASLLGVLSLEVVGFVMQESAIN